MLKDTFGFVEHQERATCGLGYKLTPTGNKDDVILQKAEAIADARIKIDNIHWYVPHYTTSIPQKGIISKQISSKTPTELRHIEGSVFTKEKKSASMELQIRKSRKHECSYMENCWISTTRSAGSQDVNNDTFCRLPVVSAQYITGTEKLPDAAILLNYDDDDYFQGYGQIEEDFRAWTKDDILQTYISDQDFRSFNEGNDVGCNLYVLDIQSQENFTAAKPTKVEFKSDRVVPDDENGDALVLTNKLVSVSSDGQRHFDLT